MKWTKRRRKAVIKAARRYNGFMSKSHSVPKLECKSSFPRVLMASNEYFHNEFAHWETIDGIWRCNSASENIKWMKGMEPADAKLELARRGYSWSWRDINVVG